MWGKELREAGRHKHLLALCKLMTPKNSEDPDEMLHNAILQFYLEIITCDPLMYKMDHSKSIEPNQMEESISV